MWKSASTGHSVPTCLIETETESKKTQYEKVMRTSSGGPIIQERPWP